MPSVSEAKEKLRQLERLVSSLPSAATSGQHVHICLDGEDIEDIGYSGALNRCLEIHWGYKAHGLSVNLRDEKLQVTLDLFHAVIPNAEDIGLVELWLDAFIDAARAFGATVPLTMSSAPVLRPSRPVLDTPKDTAFGVWHKIQTKLTFRKLTLLEAEEQTRRQNEQARELCTSIQAAEALRAEKADQLRREYEMEKKRFQRFRARKAKGRASKSPAPEEVQSEIETETVSEADTEQAFQLKQKNAAHSHRVQKLDKKKHTLALQPAHAIQPSSTMQPSSTTQPVSTSSPAEQAQPSAAVQPASPAEQPASAAVSVKPKKPKILRQNWQQYWYWTDIVAAQKAVGWSPTHIVDYLRKKNPAWYAGKGGLHKGTVARWIMEDKNGNKQWTPETLARAEKGGRLGVTRRSKALASYPHVVEAITTQLRALRAVGLNIHRPIAAAVIKAHILHKAPDVLGPNSKFKMSDSWVHKFLQTQLNWSMRKGTRASRKVPSNALELCERTFLRVVFISKLHDVHGDFVVNADQAGVVLLPTGNTTYEVKGSKDVSLLSHDEKRQMTVVLASSMSGNILPFQSIWGGSTSESLPARTAIRRNEADALGFTYGHGDTRHWSSRDTTKSWVTDVLNPYLAQMRIKHNAPDNAKSILLIDVWPIHIANKTPDDFLPWLRRTHPNIIPIFVPGGCTGLFQPADVGLQRLMKHRVKQSALDFMVAVSSRKLIQGAKPEEVTIPTDLPTLRNASIGWLVDAYRFFEANPDVVRQAWANCKTGPWSLTPESLRSDAAWARFEEVTKSDPIFAAEFARFDYSAITGNVEVEQARSWESHDDDLSLLTSELAAVCLGNDKLSTQVEVQADGDILAAEDGSEDLIPVGCPHPDSDEDKPPAIVSAPTSLPPSGESSSSLSTEQPPATIPDLSSTFLLGVAVGGGTHYAALHDDATLRKTNPRAKKTGKTQPVDPKPPASTEPDVSGSAPAQAPNKGKRKRIVRDEATEKLVIKLKLPRKS